MSNLFDPDMPAQQLRLHMGELTAQEMRTARAAIRMANSRVPDALADARREALEEAAKVADEDGAKHGRSWQQEVAARRIAKAIRARADREGGA